MLDRKKFGDSVLVFGTLKMDTLSGDLRGELIRRVEITNEILGCHAIFGERDTLIKVITSSLDEYQKFVFKLILKLPGVRDIVSTVTLLEFKQSTAIPVRGRM